MRQIGHAYHRTYASVMLLLLVQLAPVAVSTMPLLQPQQFDERASPASAGRQRSSADSLRAVALLLSAQPAHAGTVGCAQHGH